MGLFKKFYPDEYPDSTYEIDFEKKYEDGFRGVIFDIDNTLVPHGAPSDERSRTLLKGLMELGYKVMLLSNNKKARVDMFNEEIGALTIFRANKPSKRGYLRAMEEMGTTKDNTLFVGDQLFTDVLGAKNVGIHTILVKPIDKKEEIQIVIKRIFEKPILAEYLRNVRK